MMILVHQTLEMTLQNVFQTPGDHLHEKTHLFPFILELPIFAEDFLCLLVWNTFIESFVFRRKS